MTREHLLNAEASLAWNGDGGRGSPPLPPACPPQALGAPARLSGGCRLQQKLHRGTTRLVTAVWAEPTLSWVSLGPNMLARRGQDGVTGTPTGKPALPGHCQVLPTLHLIRCPQAEKKKKKKAHFMGEGIQEVLVTSPSFRM